MNTHRTPTVDWSPSTWARLMARQPHLGAQDRAQLDGLEVQDSDFSAWLDAGGERRTRPRDGSQQTRRRPLP